MIKRCTGRALTFEGIFSPTAFLHGGPHCNGPGEGGAFCIFKGFQIQVRSLYCSALVLPFLTEKASPTSAPPRPPPAPEDGCSHSVVHRVL